MSFALLLVILSAVTGFIWLLDKLVLRKSRGDASPSFIVKHSREFFPIFFIVLLLRSFIVEPFRIPSGSLEPTLLVGDFVVVNKFSYGLRLPVSDTKVVPISEPSLGNIAVFSWPPKPKFDFIKRVVGLPGDTVEYKNKVLFINGKEAKQEFVEYTTDGDGQGMRWKVEKRSENLNGVKHFIYTRPDEETFDFKVTVPKNSYFMMGDNRDNSNDSRYWGFVPERNLRGKAIALWMSWNNLTSSVRFDRIGKLIS